MHAHEQPICKTARTYQALTDAAQEAEQRHQWAKAAEFYEAAATFGRDHQSQIQSNSDALLRKAALCRLATDRAVSPRSGLGE